MSGRPNDQCHKTEPCLECVAEGGKHIRGCKAVINSPAIGGSLGPRSSMGNVRHRQAHDERASHGEEPDANVLEGRVIVTATKRTTPPH